MSSVYVFGAEVIIHLRETDTLFFLEGGMCGIYPPKAHTGKKRKKKLKKC